MGRVIYELSTDAKPKWVIYHEVDPVYTKSKKKMILPEMRYLKGSIALDVLQIQLKASLGTKSITKDLSL